MGTYIVTCDEETASWIGNDVDLMKPLVRCMDCKYREPRLKPPLYCLRLIEYIVRIELDGFCAWGEPKGESE